jgi:hypothetical protein
LIFKEIFQLVDDGHKPCVVSVVLINAVVAAAHTVVETKEMIANQNATSYSEPG